MSRIYSLTAALLVAGVTLSASAQQIERRSAASKAQVSGEEIVRLNGDARYRGFQVDAFNSGNLPKPVLMEVPSHKAKKATQPNGLAPMRVNAAGTFYGYLGYNSSQFPQSQGWYNVKVPQSTNIWSQEDYYPSCGYVRNGQLVTWYHKSTNSSGLEEMGMRVFDVASGALISQETFDLFGGYDKVVWNSAYDSDNDIVYLITSRADNGNQYQTMTYDPKTGTYKRLGDIPVSDGENSLAMAWCPEDGNVYILFDDCSLSRLDKKTGKFTVAVESDHSIGEYIGSMVYSPRDKGMVYIATSAEYIDLTEMGLIDIKTGKYTEIGNMNNDEQWLILYTSDPFVVDGAPAPVTLDSWNFTGASLAGTAKLRMPSTDKDGAAFSGSLFLEVTVDGSATPVYDKTAAAGSTVSVDLTLEEGMHVVTARPYTYKGIDKVYGAPLNIEKYVGNDIPCAPENVRLSKTQVSWNPVTKGVNNGYINTSDMTYNVYLDGVKMNTTPVSGNSLSITLPAGGATYSAEVEAVAAGKTSARGKSNDLANDGALSVPVYLGPAEGETEMSAAMRGMFTIINANNDYDSRGDTPRTWFYDEQDPHTGGFYYLCHGDNQADDYLILPGINFSDPNTVYNFNFEAWASNHPFAGTERFEVVLGNGKTLEDMRAATVIKSATEISKSENFSPIDLMFKVAEPGVKYIAIHCISDANQYRLYARNFKVTATESSMSAPAAVQDINITAAEDGTLFANVSFKMPTKTIAGDDIAAGTSLTAAVTSPVETKTVTAATGETATVKIAAGQGVNTFTICASSSEGKGVSTSVAQFVGVDIPGPAIIEKTISADNRSMKLDWRVEKRGANGGAVIPEDCTYKLMRYTGQAWAEYRDLGHETTFTYTVPAGQALAIEQFGVLAANAAGSANTYYTVGEVLGQPYGLPMKETFPYSGENVNLTYEPYMIEPLTELYPSWGFADPAELADEGVEPNDSGIALVAYWKGSSQLTLPKFSTKGMNNVKVDLNMFFGAATPTSVEVLATCENDRDHLLATFTGSDGSGWETKTVNLPANMQNRDWVAVTIRVNIGSYSQYFLLDRFEIRNYEGDDLAVTAITGDTYGNVGNSLNFTAKVRNFGSSDMPLSDGSVKVMRGSEVLETLTAARPAESLAQNDEAEYNFTLTPKVALIGESSLSFAIQSNDINADNNTMSVPFKVFTDNIPVPQNLKAVEADDHKSATVTWDEPAVNFGAEETVPGSHGDMLGAFRNIDRDELATYSLGSINYPDRFAPTAFQSFQLDWISQLVPLLKEREKRGDNILVTIASPTGTVDNWLVSPEVKGGTEVSFEIACASEADGETLYEEEISLWYSTTNDDPDSFKKVETFTNSHVEWKPCNATLPADAKYFAIRYEGTENNFCLFVDNIKYIPAQYDGTLTGYGICSNTFADMVRTGATRSWTHTDGYDTNRPTLYQAYTLMEIKGDEVVSHASNSYIVENLQVDGIERCNGGIAGGRGYIEISGNEGNEAVVMSADGRIIARGTVDSDLTRIDIVKGIYVVKCGKTTAKVVVR